MKRRRAPLGLFLLGSACSLLAPDDDFFSGNERGGSGSSDGGSASGASSGANAGAGASDPEGGALSGGALGTAGYSSGGTGAQAGAAGSSSGTPGSSGAGATSGGGGVSSVGAAGGAAGGGDVCSLPATKMESEACGDCNTGKRTRTLTLTASCTYSAGAWSACQGQTAICTPGDTSACENGDSCGQRKCSTTCTWGACAPKVAGGCLRIRAGQTREGSNYHCCGTGKWEFCLSSCEWSGECVTCSEGAPSYCTDCYP